MATLGSKTVATETQVVDPKAAVAVSKPTPTYRFEYAKPAPLTEQEKRYQRTGIMPYVAPYGYEGSTPWTMAGVPYIPPGTVFAQYVPRAEMAEYMRDNPEGPPVVNETIGYLTPQQQEDYWLSTQGRYVVVPQTTSGAVYMEPRPCCLCCIL